jgi:hypothetical protein
VEFSGCWSEGFRVWFLFPARWKVVAPRYVLVFARGGSVSHLRRWWWFCLLPARLFWCSLEVFLFPAMMMVFVLLHARGLLSGSVFLLVSGFVVHR